MTNKAIVYKPISPEIEELASEHHHDREAALEILKDIQARHAGLSPAAITDAARALKIDAITLPIRSAGELDAALARILRERVDAMLVLADRVFLHNRKRIVEFATAHRLPTMNAYRELAESGGLMSFGPNYGVMHRQAATYVDRILKGAKPADLPIEQPAKFEFVVNLKAAKSLNIAVPQSMLLLADHVIE